ncbi:MAG: hypothetical protein CMC55_08745 [Flavobacteriaceae bacterium]|nr:hypothetical protein [Flavobacteriaceae bacterium]|tara:strand:+ start:959 stop:1189 length:231 start_codon:yes stop_codon:yes gene_type:complete
MTKFFVRFQKSLINEESLLVYVEADNRAQATYKAKQYPEIIEFMELNPEYKIFSFYAGWQHKARAEGVVPDFLIGV